jgi:hypothetical protein
LPSTPSTDTSDLRLEANTLTESTNSLLPADSNPTVEAIEKKKKEKKEVAVCR